MGMFVQRFLMGAWMATGMAMAVETGYHVDADTGITLRDGFDAELLYEVPQSQGSWVAMAFDPKGRLIVSDQDDKGVFRVTLPNEGKETQVERLPGFPYEPVDWGARKVGGALGFLYAFDSLYMSTMTGVYRIRDTDGDDRFDDFQLLRKLNLGYEHSAHSMIPTADGKGIYLVSGNFTRAPKDAVSRQPAVWRDDSLLSVLPDPSGHAVGLKPPGGWVCRFDPDGENWTMMASGLRNAVDIALNREGELFTYDSDMEFDIGCPWYRPTRVNHIISGADFGWRASTANWPDYYADSIGSVLDVGPGSPTAMSFGYHSNFPGEFQELLFLCDWTFGTIYTVKLEEKGSSYVGTKREFLHGSPLNIAAMRFGPDGAMYFVTGGRTTASKLYRVRSTAKPWNGAVPLANAKQGMRDERRALEVFHDGGKAGVAAVEKAWPYLAHEDRALRYAARVAIENQSVELWRDRVFVEKNPRAQIYGALALCRHGDAAGRDRLVDVLAAWEFGKLSAEDQLALLRVYAVCFSRWGKASRAQSEAVISQLDAAYPANNEQVNAELCRVLSYLDAPHVVSKTIALMKETRAATVDYDKEMLERHQYGGAILRMMANTPNTRNIHYAYCLRQVRVGWSLEDRKYFFGWLNETLANDGGRSFAGYLGAIRQDAIEQLEEKDAAPLKGLLGEVKSINLATLPNPQGPPVAWTVDSAMKLFENDLSGRNFANGKTMFSAGRCIACHRFGGEGGQSGPDLGSVGNRFSIRDLLVAICEPNQSISEQYMASVVTLKDGSSLYGRLIYQNEKGVGVATNPFDLNIVQKAPADQVVRVHFSQASLMPPGMINGMNSEELKDLIAYLISAGNAEHAAFRKK
jgi:putative heme-binding domain-containing protein